MWPFCKTANSEGHGKHSPKCSHGTDQRESMQCVVEIGKCHFSSEAIAGLHVV